MDTFGQTVLGYYRSFLNNDLILLCRTRSRVSALALSLMLLAAATESAPDEVEALGTPTEVVVNAANRRLTVTWDEVPGATSYKIAVRPTNEFVPTWREYTATSSPYTITDMWAMSGMAYEVRVAAVRARGQSEWSSPVSITAPALQAHPVDEVRVVLSSSPVVGRPTSVRLYRQRPLENRSPWHWFICNADWLDCKVLPYPQRRGRPSWEYFMEPAMQGKRLWVQVDYDREGVSYSETLGLGAVGAAWALTTHLYDLQSSWVWVRWERAWGGAIAPLGNDLLVATPWGRFDLVRPTGEVAALEGNVPMNQAELFAPAHKKNFPLNQFRVADILLKRHSAGRYELFVTHHYFTGECFRFRLSATTLVRQGADVVVSPEWRTIFEAEPCIPILSLQAAGRMLTDGPDHLLVTMGDHQQDKSAQDPASHLGKLIRVEVATGHIEILALGLRNSQGLTRDAAGHLWGTDHGPQGGDELNLLVAGGNYGWSPGTYGVKRSRPRTRTTRPQPGNYGWPWVTYGLDYGGGLANVPRAEQVGRHDGFIKPVFAWVPAIGISSVIVNDARLFPLWKDDLLIASLRGTRGSGYALFRVRRDGTDVQYVERIDVGYRIRDIVQMPDRRTALLADGGRVHFLRRSYAHCADETQWDRSVYAIDCEDHTGEVAGAATGAQLFDVRCSGCHSLNTEQHGIGPHLVGVLGRRAGSVGGYQFSDALRSLDMTWTPAHLERFLANPQEFAPGTSKPALSITSAEARAIADFIGGD